MHHGVHENWCDHPGLDSFGWLCQSIGMDVNPIVQALGDVGGGDWRKRAAEVAGVGIAHFNNALRGEDPLAVEKVMALWAWAGCPGDRSDWIAALCSPRQVRAFEAFMGPVDAA